MGDTDITHSPFRHSPQEGESLCHSAVDEAPVLIEYTIIIMMITLRSVHTRSIKTGLPALVASGWPSTHPNTETVSSVQLPQRDTVEGICRVSYRIFVWGRGRFYVE